MKSLIEKYLPQHLWELASKHEIPENTLVSSSKLITKILSSKSIDTIEEKQNWINLLPIMNEDQEKKLNAILEKEKNKLASIEKKYENKKEEIKRKYQEKWKGETINDNKNDDDLDSVLSPNDTKDLSSNPIKKPLKKKNNLFNFQVFISDLRENSEKKEVPEKYEKYYGAIEGGVNDQLWYEEYISKFNTVNYIVPEELTDDFDWKLLMQLIGSSFSSEGSLQEIEKGEFEFVISVKSGDQTIIKKVSELWGFQILRLYEIYIEENMNLQILIAENEKENEAISAKRKELLPKWNSVVTSIEKNSIIKQSKEGLDEIFDGLI